MLHEAISKFLETGPEIMPDLCDNNRMFEADIYDDYALLPYALKKPLKMESLRSILEEKESLRVMYFAKNIKGREALCVYSNPCLSSMFKLNAVTDNSGVVFDVNVTVYYSLEIMSSDLIREVGLIKESDIVYVKNCGEFIADFT